MIDQVLAQRLGFLHALGREAQVPALLEMLRIPYTGSKVMTLALALDKPMTKRVLAAELERPRCGRVRQVHRFEKNLVPARVVGIRIQTDLGGRFLVAAGALASKVMVSSATRVKRDFISTTSYS